MKMWIKTIITASALGFGLSCQTGIDYRKPEELKSLIESKTEEYLLVDVRTEAEYDSGYIPTAINIPYTEIGEKLPVKDKSALIIVYCRSGNRSSIAKSTLDGLGYKRVVDFGGVYRWTGELYFSSVDN